MAPTQMLPAGADSGQRVFEILRNFVVRLERQPRPHPELLEMTGFAVDRYMELTYAAGALDSCLEASKISNLLGEMMQEAQPVEESRPRLSQLWSNLETVRELEHARLHPADPAPAPAAARGRNGGGGPSGPNGGAVPAGANGGASVAPPAPAPQPIAPRLVATPLAPAQAVAKPAGIPVDGTMPEGAQDGTFSYLGTPGFPYDAELTSIFLTEAGEQVPAVEALLLKMERNAFQSDGINDLFRPLHTIKGNSGFLGLREFIRLVHAMEQYLEPFRNRSVDLSAFNVGVMLEGCDALKELLANLQSRVDALTSDEPSAKPQVVDWESVTQRVLDAMPVQR